MVDQLIQSGDDLIKYFFGIRKDKEKLRDGVMVCSSIRHEVLTGVGQGKIILGGQICRIDFNNLSGGVYLASVRNHVGAKPKTVIYPK